MLMSKQEFAGHIGVTPGRISQMILSGMIAKDALEGEGRKAKVRVEAAVEQIRRKRDVGQSLGNGLSTRLSFETPSAPQDEGGGDFPRKVSVDEELKQERLLAERRRNRVAAQDDALARGQLLDAAQVKIQMRKLAQAVDDENAGMLNDFATAIAAQFQVPQRDVLHALRRIRSEKKGQAMERAKRLADAVPESVEIIIDEAVA
jgi:hypothetical protein